VDGHSRSTHLAQARAHDDDFDGRVEQVTPAAAHQHVVLRPRRGEVLQAMPYKRGVVHPVKLAVSVATILVATAAPARAQVAGADGGGGELAAAQADFESALASTSASDCATACRALESMRRAADRICALDPGTKCSDARARVEESAARVRAKCPDCGAATTPPSMQPAPPPPVSAGQARATEEESQAAPSRRGCGCIVSNDTEPSAIAAGIAIVAAWVGRLNRKRRRREGDG
jgi:hypothetical protein